MKTRNVLLVFGVLVLASLLIPMNFSAHTAENPFVTNLIAGQSIDAGDIMVWNDETDLYVKYKTDNGWMLTETHLEVEVSVEDLAQTGSGSPKIGKFDYKSTHDPPVTEHTYVIPLDSWGPGTTLYLAAHAVVVKKMDDGGWQEETGWGEGDDFDKSWAMYFSYEVQDDGKILDIPLDPVTAKINYAGGPSSVGDPSYFDVQLLFEGSGYDVYDEAWYDGWCGDSMVIMSPNQDYGVQMYLSTELDELPDYAKDDEDWEKVNYLLNQDYGADWQTMQAAIWTFTDSNPTFSELWGMDADLLAEIVADVNANSAGFYPGEGQWMAIIIDPNDGVTQTTQLMFIVVDP
jgi:hypothetical protein